MILRERVERSLRATRAAFTLMELLVVVGIIVVLAGLGGYYLIGASDNAKKTAAITQMKGTLAPAVENYRLDHDVWPQSLEMLLQRDESGHGPYLKGVDYIKTPWGTFYQLDVEQTNARGYPVIHCQTKSGTETLSNVSQ